MNMKHLNKIIILISLSIFIASCEANSLKKVYDVGKSNEFSQANDGEHSMSINNNININNEQPHEELNKEVYDIHYIAEKYFTNDVSGSDDLADISADIGVDCLRETDTGALYSIHRIKQGGILYIFYLNRPEMASHSIIRWFYVNKILSGVDFIKVKEGSTIDDIIKIDSTAQIFKNIYNANPHYWDTTGGFGSWHYLNDGILEIGYKNINGKLIVFSKELVKDYQIKYISDRVFFYDGRILPMDMIK